MKRKNLSCLIFFVGFLVSLYAQDENSLVNQGFPASWKGTWAGNLEIHNAKGLQQDLPMQLIIDSIAASNDFTFTIIYGTDMKAGTRSYILKTIDSETGHYLIDEQNSIEIDAYFLGGKLVQRFEVIGNMLETFIEKRGDSLHWEIFSGKTTEETTGDTIFKGDTIPLVKTYPINVYQKCVLSLQ